MSLLHGETQRGTEKAEIILGRKAEAYLIA
jgi:hypothetical protein